MDTAPPNGKPPAPPSIQPSPVPVRTSVDVVHTPKADLVRLAFASPTGTTVFFYDADSADRVGTLIRDASRRARIGLVLPPETFRPS